MVCEWPQKSGQLQKEARNDGGQGVCILRRSSLTYDKSKGVAGCDPARLCAKLTFPPICLAAPGGTLVLPPMGMPPPNPHPAPLPTGPANPRVSAAMQTVRREHPRGSAGTLVCASVSPPHLSSRSVACWRRRGPTVAAAAGAAGLRSRRVCRVATAGPPLVLQRARQYNVVCGERRLM